MLKAEGVDGGRGLERRQVAAEGPAGRGHPGGGGGSGSCGGAAVRGRAALRRERASPPGRWRCSGDRHAGCQQALRSNPLPRRALGGARCGAAPHRPARARPRTTPRGPTHQTTPPHSACTRCGLPYSLTAWSTRSPWRSRVCTPWSTCMHARRRGLEALRKERGRAGGGAPMAGACMARPPSRPAARAAQPTWYSCTPGTCSSKVVIVDCTAAARVTVRSRSTVTHGQ